MAYTKENFKTKKSLRDAVAERSIPVFQPGPFGPDVRDGDTSLEGPHFPQSHKWYATATVRNGMIPRGSKVR